MVLFTIKISSLYVWMDLDKIHILMCSWNNSLVCLHACSFVCRSLNLQFDYNIVSYLFLFVMQQLVYRSSLQPKSYLFDSKLWTLNWILNCFNGFRYTSALFDGSLKPVAFHDEYTKSNVIVNVSFKRKRGIIGKNNDYDLLKDDLNFNCLCEQ